MSKPIQLPLFKDEVKVSECLILIEPPRNVVDYVSILKKELQDEYGKFLSGDSKAHITISNFLVSDNRTDKVLSTIDKRLSLFPKFELQLKGFSTFDTGRTFYIGVEQSRAFAYLTNEFESIKKEVVKTTKFYSSKTAHVTIARKLSPQAFNHIKDKYISKPFYYTFDVERLIVLKRNSTKVKYEFHSYINLKN